MGVLGLWKLIEQSGKPVPLETLENKVLAVDISIWLHQVIKGYQDAKGSNLPNAHVLGLFHRLCKLLFYRIKPVFVFDGGVPELKRNTIAKRNQAKNQFKNEADRLQQLLLESLAKEKVVQQALGPAATEKLISPSKKLAQIKEKEEAKDNLFKLPPPPPQEDGSKSEEGSGLDDSNSSWDEATSRNYYNLNLNAIDVTSAHFKNLPADVRHEILTDIKETRKQSSWGRLHELPVQSNDFSSFQMKKLLKRRKVQEELEEAEKEMGGKCMSLAELESLLTEEGIAVKSEKGAQQIASCENTKILMVRDIQKQIEMAKKREEEAKNKPTTPKLMKLGEDMDADAELQYAIQMSLMPNEDHLNKSEEIEEVKLSKEQKKHLSEAAKSLARNYMLEYGGMSNEDINDLLAQHDNDEELDLTLREKFQYNDKSILLGSKDEKEEDVAVVSSDSEADSDFVDVPIDDLPDDDISGVILPLNQTNHFKPNLNHNVDFTLDDLKLGKYSKKVIEVVVDKNKIGTKDDDDIFADVFQAIKQPEAEIITTLVLSEDSEAEESPKKIILEVKRTINLSDNESEELESHVPEESCDEIQKKLKEELESLKNRALSIELPGTSKSIIPQNIDEINLQLKNELELLKEQKIPINLDDIEIDEQQIIEIPYTPKKGTLENFIISTTPKSNKKEEEEKEVVPKVPSPFFVKKSPRSSSSGKKPQQNNVVTGDHKKVSKSLFSGDDVATIIKERENEVINELAIVLKENKTEGELKEIADNLVTEQRELMQQTNKQNRMGISVTEQMRLDCMELLRYFGIPYIVAPMEAEAQCAFLNEMELTDGTITDDSDIWLFGGKTVYKNFFNQKKLVMEFNLENIEKLFNIDKKKLIQLALLVGSDYTTGINGIGTVTALEILATFPTTPEKDGETNELMSLLSGLRKFRDWYVNGKSVGTGGKTALKSKLKNIDISDGFPSSNVVEAYLRPTIDNNKETFSWGYPDAENIREYAKQKFGWTKLKTDEILLPVLKKLDEKKSQVSIKNYFKVQNVHSSQELKVSKRVQKAVYKMGGKIGEEVEEKSPKKARASVRAKKVVEKEDLESESQAKKSRPQRKTRGKKDQDDLNAPGPSSTSRSLISNIISNINDKSAQDLLGDAAVSKRKRTRNKMPDFNPAIPQKIKDKEDQESNKLKAIEVFKKSKTSKKK